jgi:hypothetical protein
MRNQLATATPPNIYTRPACYGLRYDVRMGESGHPEAEFLLTDIELANTFLDIAESTNQTAVRQRNIANTRKAHDSVAHFAFRVSLTDPELLAINERLHALRMRLSKMEAE